MARKPQTQDELDDDRRAKGVVAFNEALTEEGAAGKIGALQFVTQEYRDWIERMVDGGYITNELEALAFLEQHISYGASDDPAAKARTFAAWGRNVSDQLKDMVVERSQRHGDNSSITVEVKGRTGSGKSSVMVTIIGWIDGDWNDLENQVYYHEFEWIINVPERYRRLQEAKTAGKKLYRVHALDEDAAGVGEGSVTKQRLIKNIEGRLREASISTVFCRANADDEMTRDITLVTVGTSRKYEATICLVYVGQVLVGYARIPWPPAEAWAKYHGKKKSGLHDAANLISPDQKIARTMVLMMLTDDAFMSDLHKSGFQLAAVRMDVADRIGGMFSAAQVQRVAERVAHAGRTWGPDGDAVAFYDAVAALIRRGVARIPSHVEEKVRRLHEAAMAATNTDDSASEARGAALARSVPAKR